MFTHSLQQRRSVAEDLNVLAAFLAQNDFPGNRLHVNQVSEVLGAWPADVLVLLGNSVLGVSEAAFAAMRDGPARRLLIAGGRGHSTSLLFQALRDHPQYRNIHIDDRTEAELLFEVATDFHGIDRALVSIEAESSNCGENARFALQTLSEAKLPSSRLILVQDPTMQRRSCASFERVWQEAGLGLRIANYPTFVPEVVATADGLEFAKAQAAGLWPVERFITLLLGEVPRLRDDENGYGPKGRGYIVHVDLPTRVLNAHERLASHFRGMER